MKKSNRKPNGTLHEQLAARIAGYIRTQNYSSGKHLGEQVLADMFQVSRSPIRVALRLLEKQGLITYRKNHGFFLARSAQEFSGLDPDCPLDLEEDIYIRIAEDRRHGRLKEAATETELMDLYEVSRVRLAKVLTRIAHEGWANQRPGQGWSFPPVLETFDQLDQSIRFRMVVEPAGLLEPDFRVDSELFARIREEHLDLIRNPSDHRMSIRLFEIAARFHESLMACSGNRFFLEAVQRINRLRRIIEYRVKVTPERIALNMTHLEILDLLEAGKMKTAADLLRWHFEKARRGKISANTPSSIP